MKLPVLRVYALFFGFAIMLVPVVIGIVDPSGQIMAEKLDPNKLLATGSAIVMAAIGAKK